MDDKIFENSKIWKFIAKYLKIFSNDNVSLFVFSTTSIAKLSSLPKQISKHS